MTTDVPGGGRTFVALLSSPRTGYRIRTEQDQTMTSSSPGYASCCALSCLSLQCVSASNASIVSTSRFVRGREDMVLPGEVRSTSTGMITLPANDHSLRPDTGGCRSFPWNATRPRKAAVVGSRATSRLDGPSLYPRSTTLLHRRSPLSRSFPALTVNVTSPFPSEETRSSCAA